MRNEHLEEYLGAIYRLRESPEIPLPLPQLQTYLNYTLISIHEMIRKLETEEYIQYIPYKGVTLTPNGELVASSLIRRHRIWERFLVDKLSISWDNAHTLAGELEHAAPELVTERLAILLGDPDQCPHGCTIPPKIETQHPVETSAVTLSAVRSRRLSSATAGEQFKVSLISPEISTYLQQLQAWGIGPGTVIQVLANEYDCLTVQSRNSTLSIPHPIAQTIWGNQEPPGELMVSNPQSTLKEE